MTRRHYFLVLFFIIYTLTATSQSQFSFLDENQKEQSVRFNLINNLIVIPLEVNGKQLSFILDTGVNKTILFNLSKNDSIGLNDVKRVTLQGLGGGNPIEALISQNNTMRIKNFVGKNQEIYVILKDKFDVSGKMGVTIHGIVGYNILKDVIVHINYSTKRLYFYNPKFYKYNKCRKCDTFSLQFYRNKPYIEAKVQLDTIGNKLTDVKLLIDSGGSEALWLFENTKEEIKTPIRHFRDFLGEGLSGTIFGNKSRVKRLSIGKFEIKNPTASFLDSASTFYARQFKERNGSIGGNILRRFKVWIDYPNKKMILKKNGSLKGGFEYNMSGIDVVYNGKILVKEREEATDIGQYNLDQNTNNIATVSLYINYRYRFKPSYKIKNILPNSPADLAGLQKDDVIIEINGVKTHSLTLKELLNRFQTGHNKRVRMKIERKGEEMKFEFRLVKKV